MLTFYVLTLSVVISLASGTIHYTDNNTLPTITNCKQTEAYIEALIHAGIANEIMLPD